MKYKKDKIRDTRNSCYLEMSSMFDGSLYRKVYKQLSGVNFEVVFWDFACELRRQVMEGFRDV